MTKVFSKFIIFFLVFLGMLVLSFSYEYNSSYTDLTIEQNGWCQNLEIIFQIWNSTDYENKDAMEDNLCILGCKKERCTDSDPDDCIRCEKGCVEYDIMDNVPVKVYNGPMKSINRTLLFDGTTNATGSFAVTFPRPDQYLLEMLPSGNYNDYHDLIDIQPCSFAQDTTIAQVNEEKNLSSIVLEDYTFEYPENRIVLDIKQTQINDQSQISINENPSVENKLNNINITYKMFEITSEEPNFSAIEMKIYIGNISSQNNIKLYKYDTNTKIWSDMKYQLQDNNIVANATSLGIYAITYTPQIENSLTNVTNSSVEQGEEQIQVQPSSISPPTSSTLSKANNKNIIVVIVVGLCTILLIVMLIAKKHRNPKDNYHDYRNNQTQTIQKEEEHMIPSSYRIAYDKTTNYVLQYKEEYTKDQIYRALIKANIPKDIVDKVLNEQY